MDYPTTPKNLADYQKAFRKWARRFGLQSYYYTFEHIDLEDQFEYSLEPEALAAVSLDAESRVIAVLFNRVSCGEKPTQRSIDMTAFHEAREVFYFDIRRLLVGVYAKEKVNEIIHQLIRTDENLFFNGS